MVIENKISNGFKKDIKKILMRYPKTSDTNSLVESLAKIRRREKEKILLLIKNAAIDHPKVSEEDLNQLFIKTVRKHFGI